MPLSEAAVNLLPRIPEEDFEALLEWCPAVYLHNSAELRGLPRDQVYDLLAELEKAGLIESIHGTDSFRYQRMYRRKPGV